MHYFSISQIYFGIELYMIWTGLLSIIRILVLYTQQQVFVILVVHAGDKFIELLLC